MRKYSEELTEAGFMQPPVSRRRVSLETAVIDALTTKFFAYFLLAPR